MFISRIHQQNDLISKALNATALRNDVIQNNIANVDTPGFRRSNVVFETEFANAVEAAGRTGSLRSIEPRVATQHANFTYRIDGNNVDIESEMVALFQNAVRYDVMVMSVLNNYRRINLAYQQ